MSETKVPTPSVPRSFTQSTVNLITLNEDVLEKLKILGYEQEIRTKRPALKPLHRTYFAMVDGKKSADPFKWYEALVGWLLKTMRVDHLEWNEFDDPNEICEQCVEQIKKLGYTGDLTMTKLRSGTGEAVLLSLDWLLERALDKKKFKVSPPTYAESGDAEEAAVDDQAEINDEVIEEEAIAEEEEYMGAAIGHTEETKMSVEEEEERQRQAILESKVDPVEWNLELERVGPQLKSRSQPASKEWRTHLEQSAKHEKQLAEAFPPAKSSLEKMANKLHEVVQRIESKEGHMNSQFKHLGAEFRVKQEEFDKVQQTHETLSASIKSKEATFEEMETAVRDKETLLSEKHNSVTDAAPLKRIQNSLAALKKEVGVMELRIGVVGQTLLQSKLKHQMMHQHHQNNPNLKASTSPLNRLSAADDDY